MVAQRKVWPLQGLCRPDGAGEFIWRRCYKYVAPMALARRGGRVAVRQDRADAGRAGTVQTKPINSNIQIFAVARASRDQAYMSNFVNNSPRFI